MTYRFWCRLVVVSLILTAPTLAASRVNSFDGKWVGELRVTFTSSICGAGLRLEMTVTEGAATGSATRGSIRRLVWGSISPDGKFTWNLAGGKASISSEAMVDGNRIQGDWQDDTGHCAGTITMEKTS